MPLKDTEALRKEAAEKRQAAKIKQREETAESFIAELVELRPSLAKVNPVFVESMNTLAKIRKNILASDDPGTRLLLAYLKIDNMMQILSSTKSRIEDLNRTLGRANLNKEEIIGSLSRSSFE